MAYYREGKKQPKVNLGAHFSKHVHGMFVKPQATIRNIIKEQNVASDLTVPAVVMIIAGIMSAIGSNMWNIIVTPSYVHGLFYTAELLLYMILFPIYMIFLWLIWTGVFHFMGSIVSGKNIANKDRVHKTLKLVGLCMVPAFLNILPLFSLFTGLWIWMLIMWSVERNYETSRAGAFIIALPYIFVWAVNFLWRIGLM